jgi:hypothetical protein
VFEILGGRKSFFQWDLNQKLIVYDDSITEVHFCNKSADCALVCEVYTEASGEIVVDVPNILLQANRCIRAYGVAADHTEHYARFEVISRSKPADYVYTETEVKTFSTLEQRMDELEASVSVEGVAKAVEDYLTANPPQAGATAEERAQITQNAKDISGLYEQAAGFALKSEIPNLEPYALKAEIPSVDGFATTGYVDNAVNNAKPNLEPYALKTDIPSVPTKVSALANDAGYQTAAQVESIVDEAIKDIDIPTGGGSGGGSGSSSGWKKVAEYVWDGNKEYQPLTLDYATGEMTFAETPSPYHVALTVNTDGISTATDILALYAKVPDEFFKNEYLLSPGANGGYTYAGNTSIVEGGVNANVDVSAFRFERSGTAPSFTGLNSKRIKIRMMFPGGNAWLNNACFVFQCTLSNGANILNMYPTSIDARAMVGTIEQEFCLYDNVLSGTYSYCIWSHKNRTNQNQPYTEKKDTKPIIWKAVPEGVTITGVSFVGGNGNWWPCNGTVVEVYAYED